MRSRESRAARLARDSHKPLRSPRRAELLRRRLLPGVLELDAPAI